ncbi:MAG: hypothetical protein ASARMPRED_003057 [Alectoria sarmentosa]|nr:MAG: hypothetical protein ASARMPRED_003057 [Alectoria sarmentosa]
MLWTLNDLPEQPKDNTVGRESDETRQLPPERERQLAENFAFISASTDNMRRVMAVCVEENLDKKGITIRVASNTGDLSRIKEKLDGIAKTLETAALRVESRISVRQSLFRQIVILDIARILSRLRSRHAARTRKTEGKPCLLPLLHKSVNDSSMKPRGKVGNAKLVKVRSQVDRLVKTFDRFEAAHDDHSPTLSIDILVELLVQARDFDVENLRGVLRNPSSINPSVKAFLPEAVSKLGHYNRVACDLFNAVRSPAYTIFGRISIVALEEPVLDTSWATDGPVGFDKVLRRITRLSHRHHRWQHLSGSLPAARTKFQSRMSNSAIPWKVHAEIQLLFYYERNPDIPLPRTICSSKSACYLCDLFIKTHGKFHIPSTHGKLYDRWMLPEWPENGYVASEHTFSIIERFNTVLEAKILQTLNHARLPSHPPNESVLHVREPWSSTSTIPEAEPRESTVETSDPVHHVLREQEEPSSPRSAFADPGSSSRPARDISVCVTQEPFFECAIDDDMHAIQEPSLGPATYGNVHATQEPVVEPASASNVHVTQEPSLVPGTLRLSPRSEGRRTSVNSSRLATSSDFLIRGDTIYRKLTHPSETLIVRTDEITLHVSSDWRRADSNDHTSAAWDPCWAQVRCLAWGVQIEADDEGYDCIDLGTLDSDCDKVVQGGAAFGSKALCLKKGEHALTLQYSLDDPRKG